jgi:hypothetical protein
VAREPSLGEEIMWEGRPQRVETPAAFRAGSTVAFIAAAACTSFALVAALGLAVTPGPMLLCAAWLTTVGFGLRHAPRWWRSPMQYVITSEHVMWRRGPLHRAIRRDQISYARIFWNSDDSNVGDLELVRAVPAGVLKRRLLIRLHGLAAPDKVWALVREINSRSECGAGDRALSQRLEEGERVLWSARPSTNWRRFLPHGKRRWQTLALALTLTVGAAHLLLALSQNLRVLIAAGLWEQPAVFAALLVGEALMLTLMVGTAGFLLYTSTIRPGRQLGTTHYLITNRRVLIQRGREELHLDRRMIVDVIDSPTMRGLKDVFLVLDGPQARALELGGAFGETERDAHLKPVLEAVADAESVSNILLRTPPSIPPARGDIAA